MSHPHVPIVRVGYMAPALPYPVQVLLPPTTDEDTRTQIRTTGPFLDIAVPRDPSRHEKLGRFLDAWSGLESTLAIVLTKLLPLRLRETNLIISQLGTRNAIDLLEGIGRRNLESESVKVLTALLDRVTRLNTKRNVLVHGHWILEANVIVRRGEACLATQFLREVTPTDPEEAKALANPRNQKERVRYTFTLKRIDAATRDTDKLNIDICNVFELLKRKIVPLDEIGTELSLSRPYLVTYSKP
jgi:hypothetical protein